MQTVKSEPLVRKQIMLSNENLKKLSLIASEKKTSVAHIVRNAVDSYEPDYKDIDALQELMEYATQKLRDAVEDTRTTRKHLRKTLDNLSTKAF